MENQRVLKQEIEDNQQLEIYLSEKLAQTTKTLKAAKAKLKASQLFAVGNRFHYPKSSSELLMVGLGDSKVCLIQLSNLQRVGNIVKVKASGGITRAEFEQISGGVNYELIERVIQ